MKKRVVIVFAVLALGGAAIFVQKHFRKNNKEDVLKVSGNVEVTEVDAGFKLPGRINATLVEEGDKVHKGEKIAALESAELESEVARAEASLSEAEARLKELRAGSRPQERKEAESEVSLAEAELTKAKKDFERADMLFTNGAISASQYDSFRKTLDSSEARLRGVKERLSLVKEGPRKEEIKAALYRVKQAEAALSAVKERLKDAVIHAPADGVVLRKNNEAGETVFAGMSVYTIGNLGNPWIKVYVKEDKLGVVKLGQKARVMTDSYPGKVYQGIVTYISSEAEFTPKNVQTKEERVRLVFGVKVSVKNENDELKPGMPADVEISLK